MAENRCSRQGTRNALDGAGRILDLKRAKADGLAAKASNARALMSRIRFLKVIALARLNLGLAGAEAPRER